MNFSTFNFLVLDGPASTAAVGPVLIILDPKFQSPLVDPGTTQESGVDQPIAGDDWTFGAWTGVAADGSDIAGSVVAPGGAKQAAFLRAGNASLSQPFDVDDGIYTVQFDAAWGANASRVHFPMRLDVHLGHGLIWVSPFIDSTSYATYKSPSFSLSSAFDYRIEFLSDGGGTCAYTNVVLISNVSVNLVV